MNMAHPPPKEKINLDFVLFLLFSRQWLAFKKERKYRDSPPSSIENNDSVHLLLDEANVVNPVPDFTTYTRNYLDNCNNLIFFSSFYIALMAVFLAGAMRPTIYSFGFILLASILLWEGSDLFLRPPNKILLRWNVLIAYNILVMLATTISQVFGCILQYENSFKINCAIYRLFSVGCVDQYKTIENVPNVVKNIALCKADYEALGLEWDCCCFLFLIFQQRIFKSFYFHHIVNDAKANTILADRGAELIEEERRIKRIAIDNERSTIEQNIKKKMDKLKANSEKIKAIRAGDYRNFEQVDREIDVPLLPIKEEVEEEYQSFDPMPLAEYLGLFYLTNIDTVLEVTRMRNKRKKVLRRRALGLPRVKSQAASNISFSDTSIWTKILKLLEFVWGIFESIIVSITGFLNKASRRFRLILNGIQTDRITLKKMTTYSQGVRLGANHIWNPLDNFKDILIAGRLANEKTPDALQYSIYVKLLIALWYFFMAYSEWLCYFIIILFQTLESDFISLPLVLMIFCWGALTVPKPSKTFWVVMIAFALIMVLIKNVFEMGIAPWGKDETKYNFFFPPSMIGLFNNLKGLNLLLLASLFFHRVVLRRLGLWKPYRYRTISIIENGYYIQRDGIFYKSNITNNTSLVIETTEVSRGDYFPKSILHGMQKYAEVFRLYIQQLIYPSSTQIPVDVYMAMFLCDLCNLLLIIFRFGHFQNDLEVEGLIDIFNKNRVPVSFLVLTLTYMLMMMIDRGLYLRRNRFGKIMYHFFQVIAIHVWFFIFDPMMTNRHFNDAPVVQTFYMFKCMYFLLSAYQIRNGYPTLISFHYLWRGYSLFYRFSYKLYRIIPYCLEIRCLLDWICSDSCLGIPAWFKMEDVTQSLFDQKCQQVFDVKWIQPSGRRQNRINKLLIGGFLYLLLVLTVIFPFVLFSMSSSMGVTTRPKRIKMELYMGRAQPFFRAYVPDRDIFNVSKSQYKNLSESFNNIHHSEDIFNYYDYEDVKVVKWSINSLVTWGISKGSKAELAEELANDQKFTIRLEINYIHVGNGGEQIEKTFAQNTFIPPLPNENRARLLEMVKSKNGSDLIVWLPLIFPKFLEIQQDGTPRVLSMMEAYNDSRTEIEEEPINEDFIDGDDDLDLPQDPKRLRNLLISIKFSKKIWWQVKEDCDIVDDNYLYYLKDLVHNDCGQLVIYLFNEKVFSSTMHFVTRSGILGLYLLYFMVVIQVIRGCRADVSQIWIKELPNTEKLYRKCMEIYVARDLKNFELEHEIFEEIICIMRSREILIKLSRYEDNNYNPTFIIPGNSK